MTVTASQSSAQSRHADAAALVDAVDIDGATVERYKRTYNMPEAAPVTPEMVRTHWELERALTRRLLASTPATRWATWEECYSTLYQRCSWLSELSDPPAAPAEVRFGHFLPLLGSARTIYEVGSGEGGLARFLAAHGYKYVATEITRERGDRTDADGIEWRVTDGVNLAEFEPAAHYDVVLSTQVVEHLHPEDMGTHLRGAMAILRPGGKYIVATPHVFFGPADLSAVFGKKSAVCMHLKEYAYREFEALLRDTGFVDVKAIYVPPERLRGRVRFVIESKAYLRYLCLMERGIAWLRRVTRLRPPRLLLRMLGFIPDVFLSARKPRT